MSASNWLSRRRLLHLFAGVGGVGFVAGAGTYATLHDSEDMDLHLRSGEFDIEIAGVRGDATPSDFVADDSIALSFGDIAPGTSGRAAIAVRSCSDPALVRLGFSTVSDASSPLLDELEVTTTLIPSDEASQVLFEGTLGGLIDEFDSNSRLDSCVGCEPTVLDLTWTLPSDASTAVHGETVELETIFAAEQCHGRRTTTEATQ